MATTDADAEPRSAVEALDWIAYVCGELPPEERSVRTRTGSVCF